MTEVEWHSTVEQKLLAVVSQVIGKSVPRDVATAVSESISAHSLSTAAVWLVPLLDRLLAGLTTPHAVEIPAGYPSGENGLANFLADNAGESWADVEDYGEEAVWRLPPLGLEVFFSREHRADWHTYQVRRLDR